MDLIFRSLRYVLNTSTSSALVAKVLATFAASIQLNFCGLILFLTEVYGVSSQCLLNVLADLKLPIS